MMEKDRDVLELEQLIGEAAIVVRTSVMAELYASEINFSIVAFYQGITVRIGDELNGFKVSAQLASWREVEPWLTEQALIHHPGSEFARRRVAK